VPGNIEWLRDMWADVAMLIRLSEAARSAPSQSWDIHLLPPGCGRDSGHGACLAAEVLFMSIKRTALATIWHFECPKCAFTDAEVGRPARAEAIHCEVCLEDGQRVRLKRWPAGDLGAFSHRRAA
jgi:hypothetical protein